MNKKISIDRLLERRDLEGWELLCQWNNFEIYENSPDADLNSSKYLKARDSLYRQIEIYGGKQK
ncbi:MAG: hypothetical protein ISS82_01450 [Nanoarchaeota archaeon]|nr:hypothetical protein [Nanoarchaeota archaeon]